MLFLCLVLKLMRSKTREPPVIDRDKKYKRADIPRAPFYIRIGVPTVVQMEIVECGAASLCSVLSYYGKHISLEEMRVATKVTRDGVSAFNILKAAESYGMFGEAHRVEIEDLYDLPLPFIAYWDSEHFVVIEGFSRDKVYIMDPAVGKTSISYEDLNNSFSGIVLIFAKTPEFEKTGKPFNLMVTLREIFKKDWVSFSFAIFTGLCLIFPLIAIPALGQIFVDNILINKIYSWGPWFLFSIFIVMLLKLFLKYTELNILSRIYVK